MKKVILSICSAAFICLYLVSNMGFGVCVCERDGTSKVMLLVKEEVCGREEGLDVCCCDEPNDRCCQTFVYVVDIAQDINSQIKIDISTVVSELLFHSASTGLYSYGLTPVSARYSSYRVPGPDGGLTAFAPLRL